MLLLAGSCTCGDEVERPPPPLATPPPLVSTDHPPEPACPPPIEHANEHAPEVLDQRKLRASASELRQLSGRLTASLDSAARCLEPARAASLTLLHATILRELGEHTAAHDAYERVIASETPAPPDTLAAALVGRALLHLASGDQSAAEQDLRASTRHRSVPRAVAWLAGERDCSLELDPKDLVARRGWPALGRAIASLDESLSRRGRSPSRSSFRCPESCDRRPTTAELWVDDDAELIPRAVLLGSPSEPAGYASLGWMSFPGWGCNDGNTIAASVQQRLSSTRTWYRIEVTTARGEWLACDQVDCTPYCLDAGHDLFDVFFDEVEQRAVLVVERSQRVGSWELEAAVSAPPPGASELGMPITLRVEGSTVELAGCGRRETVPLAWSSPEAESDRPPPGRSGTAEQ